MSDASGVVPANSISAPAPLLTRGTLFAACLLLAIANAMAGQAIHVVIADGWAVAFATLLGFSAIVWVALAAGFAILRSDIDRAAVRLSDLAAAAVVVVAALIPVAAASGVALTLLSFYAVLAGAPGSALRRAGFIFLTTAGAMLWGRMVLEVFSRPLLDVDALFVSMLIGAAQRGNMLWGPSGFRIIVGPACSSVQGISLALLFWVTINQYFKVPFGRWPVLWCLAAIAVSIAINVVRIAALLAFPDHFDAIHAGWGFHLSMWVTLVLVVSICVYGARREIFVRA